MLTGSPELMYEIEKDQKLFDRWKKANYDFMAKKFSKENIVRFVLHLDEKTPHIHCVVVPISPKGRLSASYYLDWTLTKNFKMVMRLLCNLLDLPEVFLRFIPKRSIKQLKNFTENKI